MQHFWNGLLDNVVLLLVALPIVGAGLVVAVSRGGIHAVRRSALTNVGLTCVLAMLMVAHYDPQRRTQPVRDSSARPLQLVQMQTSLRWLGARAGQTNQPQEPANRPNNSVRPPQRGLDVRFAVGVDGISLWFVGLAVWLTFAAVVSSWGHEGQRPATYYSLLLVLESSLVGLFAAQDVVVFYIFLEVNVLLLFFLIGVCGGYERRAAVEKILVFNLAGSVLILLGLLGLVLAFSWLHASLEASRQWLTFSIPRLIDGIRLGSRSGVQAVVWYQTGPWILVALMAGFGMHVPLFPFHAWLPDAMRAAPTAVRVLLCGAVLKVGCYGMLRFVVPFLADAAADSNVTPGPVAWLIPLVTFSVVYSALLAITQDRLLTMVTFASLSHLGMSILGLLTLDVVGVSGAVLQSVSHGLAVSALLLIADLALHDRGVPGQRPAAVLSNASLPMRCLFGLCVLSIIGVPGLSGFVGDFMTVFALFRVDPRAAAWMLVAALLLAWAFVPWVRAGAEQDSQSSGQVLRRTSTPKLVAVVPLAAFSLWIGVYPQFFLDRITPTVSYVVMFASSDDGPPHQTSDAKSRIQSHNSSGEPGGVSPRTGRDVAQGSPGADATRLAKCDMPGARIAEQEPQTASRSRE